MKMTFTNPVTADTALIRDEQATDYDAVRALNASAFDTAAEARLVDALREQAAPLVSLVAEQDGAIIGHILFTPVALSGRDDLEIMALAPMAVAPSRQRQGIGSALVSAGLDRCRALGAGAAVVLGHPAFYPRFGFVPSVRFGIVCEYDVPQDAFMVVELEPGFLQNASGTIRYHAAFRNL
jgi:putative acetyltransferase